jgi:aromatic ring-opening dioxygenase catalytic subunit (LigB family)
MLGLCVPQCSLWAFAATETGLQVASMLQSAGLSCEVEHRRGLDHGVWTPLFLLFPEADVPVCCLSVRADLDSDAHIRAVRAHVRVMKILMLFMLHASRFMLSYLC